MPQILVEFIAQISAQIFIIATASYLIIDRHFSKSRG